MVRMTDSQTDDKRDLYVHNKKRVLYGTPSLGLTKNLNSRYNISK